MRGADMAARAGG